MNSQDQNKFKELITVMSETYGEEFTPAKLKLWWNLFKPYPIETFEQALYAHIACPDAGMFSPKPANLMKFINGTSKDQQQLVEDRAEIAWACIEREISRIGSYGTLELEDKQAIAAVKAIGGWRALCMCTYDQLVWKKKEFVSSYDCYERTPLEALPSKLPGLIELSEHKAESQQGVKSLMDGLNEYRNRKGIEQK
jgi:hypothetical protein